MDVVSTHEAQESTSISHLLPVPDTAPALSLLRPRTSLTPLSVVERIPTQRAAAATATPEPLEQASAVEEVPTRTAPLIR